MISAGGTVIKRLTGPDRYLEICIGPGLIPTMVFQFFEFDMYVSDIPTVKENNMIQPANVDYGTIKCLKSIYTADPVGCLYIPREILLSY